MKIIYIKGGDNCVADALSQLPEKSFLDEHLKVMAPHKHWWPPIGSTVHCI